MIFLLLIGGTGLTLSGINWYIGIAVWIAPVFLLMYTRKAKWYQFAFFFLVVSVSGAISQTCINLFHLTSVNIFNGISFGISYSIPYIIDKVFYKKNDKFYYSLIFPSAIIIVEYTMSYLIGTWGSISHTQYEIKSLLQLSSITGIFGITFIVAWFPSIVNWIIEKKSEHRLVYKSIIIYGSVVFIVLLYGELRMNYLFPTEKTVKTAAILSENDLHKMAENEKENLEKLSKDYTLEIPSHIYSDSSSVKTLIDRTYEASKHGAKIIVWNECALILNQQQKKNLISEIGSVCLKEKVYVLLAFLEECSDQNKKPFNNKSVLVSPKGEVVWEYMKSNLHPYAEDPIINRGNCEIPVIQTEYGKIGNVICYDLDLPKYIKQAGKQSVDILLVPAYDWAGITPLHSQMACLEAIQFGFSVVRSNGKGLTGTYDYMGNTISSVNSLTSHTKIVYSDVPIKAVNTFYSYTGDIIVYLAVLFLIFLIIIRFIKSKLAFTITYNIHISNGT